MCTALTLESKDNIHFFGRTMDIEYEFNQSVLLVPRNYTTINKATNLEQQSKYAVMGMGTVMDNHPMMAEAFNEHGLACAGLNFPKYASYEPKINTEKINVPAYDMIYWIVSNFKNVKQIVPLVDNLQIVGKPFAPNVPVPSLHWIVYDTTGDCIVIEKTAEKLAVYENTVGVLSNSPEFDWHLTNLNQYVGLSNRLPHEEFWHKQRLSPDGQGLGLFGLPGSSYPSDRFVRAAFMRGHCKDIDCKTTTLSTFFHMLDNLSMPCGTVITSSGEIDITLYSCAICLEEQVYYYKTYGNFQINAVAMKNENLNRADIKVFPYLNENNINHQNGK